MMKQTFQMFYKTKFSLLPNHGRKAFTEFIKNFIRGMVLQFTGMVSRWVSTIISYSIILRGEIVKCKKSKMQWRCVLFHQKIVILTEDDPGIPKNSLAKSDTNILFIIVIVARYYCTRSLLQEILKGTKIYCAPKLAGT